MLRSSAATSTISAGVGISNRLDRLLILASARRHDPEGPHFPRQGAALDTEYFGGPRHVALLRRQRAQDVLLFELVARIMQRRDRGHGGPPGRAGAQAPRQAGLTRR